MNAFSLKDRIRSSRFFAGEQPGSAPVTLNHRRIFILPTASGLGFVLLMTLLLLIAFVYNNNLVYLLTFLSASIFFITTLHSFKSLSGLVLQEGCGIPAFAGEAAGFVIHIDNPADEPRPNLKITLQQTVSLSINAQSRVQVTLYSSTRERGWHQAGTVTLSSTFPLGLFRAWSPVRFNLKALVYPKPAPPDIPFPQTAPALSQQGLGNKGADDFYGLQDYQAGDPVKRIHWKAFAKGQGLYSKQYGGESSAEVWLDYDYASGRDVEERLSRLCRWVIDADSAGIRYGFALPGFKLLPGSGALHSRKCLEALALF